MTINGLTTMNSFLGITEKEFSALLHKTLYSVEFIGQYVENEMTIRKYAFSVNEKDFVFVVNFSNIRASYKLLLENRVVYFSVFRGPNYIYTNGHLFETKLNDILNREKSFRNSLMKFKSSLLCT